jgi:predicted glutamine amidotransferase
MMCRILAFHVEKLDFDVVNSLVKAARADPLSASGNHPDGWGVAAYVRVGGEWSQVFYRSQIPIYEDNSFHYLLSLLRGEEVIGVIHARKAGRKFLRGIFHNHPYYLREAEFEAFFAHNGSVTRDILPNRGEIATDSYLLFSEMRSWITQGPEEAMQRMMRTYGQYSTSLNSALLVKRRSGSPSLHFLHFYNPTRMREKEDYYRVFTDGNYVVSSSLTLYSDRKWKQVPNGVIVSI